MAGLFAAHLLLKEGWAVRIYERVNSEMAGRGAGIVTHPELFDILDECGIDSRAIKIGVPVAGRRVFANDGEMIGELPLAQVLTSWGRLYRLLWDLLPAGIYHHGYNVEHVHTDSAGVTVAFSNGEEVSADLLVGADGIFSTIRKQLLPDVMPTYAGYIAWRGLVDERDLSPKTRADICDYFAFSLPPGEQMLGYPVAGADEATEPGSRRFNFVWYRPAPRDTVLKELLTDTEGATHELSIPPHLIRPPVLKAVREDAIDVLSPQFAEVVTKTKQPLIQAILDLETPQMVVNNRVALIGDAAFVARPHVGMGVTKAAGDAHVLAKSLAAESDDIGQGLKTFATQRLAFGRAVVQRARHLGVYMQAQIATDEERKLAEIHRRPDRVMAETAVTAGIVI
ncbi:FAD binding domain-containing protein [Ensifer adhaerens]|nr:FAD binding domain-containing protein [Ensifer adhaerens]